MSSRRNYVTAAECDEYIGSGSTTNNEISEAEELIDAFVGYQEKHFPDRIQGKLASVSSATQMTLDPLHQNNYDDDYFVNCYLEIIGGVGIGQRSKITASTKAGVVTVEAFSTAPDSTSFYKIYQLGKFPRVCDVEFNSDYSPARYFKTIPEAIKRAVCAQVEFMREMGDDYFQGDAADKNRETIGNYSYTKDSSSGNAGLHKIIAPKAKLYLRGIINRKGVMIV